MASVRVGRFVLDADDLEEVEMIEKAVAILRENVIEETQRALLIERIEALIDEFVSRFGAITIEGAKVDDKTGEIIPISDIKIVKGMNVFCE